MNEAQYRKALLLTRIDAHRSILRLELRLARSTVDPWGTLLSLLGVDGALTGAIASSLRSILGGRPGDPESASAIVPLLVAALLPLVETLRPQEKPTAEPPAKPESPP